MATSQQIVQAAIDEALSGLAPADKWRESYLSFQNEVFSKAAAINPARAAEARFSGTLPIHMLPITQQAGYVSQFRQLTGLDSVLNSLGDTPAGIMGNMTTIRGLETASPFGVLPITYQAGDHPAKAILSGLNLNYDERIRPIRSGLGREGLGARVASRHFGPGMTSLPMLREGQPGLTPGSKAMVFDIETAGLRRNQIREVSWSSGVLGGEMTNSQVLSRPRSFARGTVGVRDGSGKVGSMPLEDFVNKHNYGGRLASAPVAGVGEDFAEKMTPFLNQVIASDSVIGHNIGKFDIPQVFQQLAGTRRYRRDSGFRTLVDTAHEHARAKMVDTLTMAQNATNLSGISVAPELAKQEKFTRHSISNLLLETNLLDLDPSLKAHITGQGLHIGEADAAITMSLAQNMHKLSVSSLGDGALRKSILDAAAITPLTNVADISDPVRRHLARVGVTNTTMNPIEHQALETRNMHLGLPRDMATAIDPNSLLFGNNAFERAVYPKFSLDRDPSNIFSDMKRMSADEFAGVQKDLAARGMPFAGLSMEERAFGTSLSRITGKVGYSPTSLGHRIADLSTDVMHSRFGMFDASDKDFRYLTGTTGRLSMPASVLEGAGLLNTENPALLGLSRVAPTELASNARVNLMYGLQEGDRETLASHLESLAAGDDEGIINALGLDMEELRGTQAGLDYKPGAIAQTFRESLADGADGEAGILSTLRNPDLKGVAIGQLQPNEAEGVINLMEQFNVTDFLRDDKSIGIGVAYGGRDGGIINAYGAVLTRHLGTEQSTIATHVATAKRAEAGYRALAEDRNMFTLAKHSSEVASGAAVNKVLQGTHDIFQKVKGHFGLALAGVAALGIADVMYKHHKRNEFYSQAMQQMSFEGNGTSSHYNSSNILQAQIASGVNKSYQRYDPLSTAFVTNDLNNGKINHTSMAWDKNNTLYGGVL